MDSADVHDLARRYWERVWGGRDLDELDDLLTDPYTRHSGMGNKVLRRDEVKQEVQQAWALLHGARTTIDDQAVAGDKVWTRATTRGVNLQTGERSVLTWMIVHRVENGRFAESWSATLPGVDWAG